MSLYLRIFYSLSLSLFLSLFCIELHCHPPPAQEAGIVIVSPVADAHALGFLCDNRRLNVLLSRAQQSLIVLGDMHAWLGTARAFLVLNFPKFGNFISSTL